MRKDPGQFYVAAPQPPTVGLRFRWPWRPYQERVLEALDSHLYNRRLHIVAAPGSGKTVLGLEVFRRLGQPAVVLSPTRTIRDQWIERLGDFLDGQDPTNLPWKSRDLAALQFFSSLTYQALHTRMRLDSAESSATDIEVEEADALEDEVTGAGPAGLEVDEVVACFRKAGIKVLILDEAHHLRAEWWSALQKIVEALDDLILVSLTATPPYDVVGHEWTRYIELCGPIDEEISVPELVRVGTLCPHQDYIWLVRCAGGDTELLTNHRNAVGFLVQELLASEPFLQDVLAHQWIVNPELSIRQIMQAPDTAIALLAFLAARGQPAHPLQKMLDLRNEDLPELDEIQWERLLRVYLFGEGWPDNSASDQRRADLARRLRADRLLWRRELNLSDAGRHWPRLSLSNDKAKACVKIHQIECQQRQQALRQVILTDYIRDEDYQQPVQRELPLGAWPIFNHLVSGASPCRVSALVLHTGRLTIVHHSLIDRLAASFDDGRLQVREVPALTEFRQVQLSGDRRLTRTLTQLLNEGDIQVLVGTRALLGEGWDAPPVNSLILASVVGSFMTTNQMRGRAIRIDPAVPDKVASIWHIGAFAQTGPLSRDVRDLEDLINRFETFVGLDHKKPVIEAGINRLRPRFWRRGQFRFPINDGRLNRVMARRLADRDGLLRRWKEALDEGQVGRILPTVSMPKPPKLKVFGFWGTFRVLLNQLIGLALVVAGWLYYPTIYSADQAGPGAMLMALGAGLILLTGPAAIRLLILYFRFLPVDGSLRGIALATREALCDSELLSESHRNSRLICCENPAGDWSIALGHGSFAEQSLFAECVQQVLAPIDNPRYLITRRQFRFRRPYVDFHAVPMLLAVRKDRAQHFLRAWQRRVCPAKLIYTRSDEGRLMLLQARMRAFSNQASTQSRRLDRWF